MRVAKSMTTIPSFWKLVAMANAFPYVPMLQDRTSAAEADSNS